MSRVGQPAQGKPWMKVGGRLQVRRAGKEGSYLGAPGGWLLLELPQGPE